MNSMTGFGRAQFQLDRQPLRIEVRSLNHRFLDLRLRLPWSDAELESRVAAAVRERLARGRVELSVVDDPGADNQAGLQLNHSLARDLSRALTELSELLGCDPATAARLLPPQRELLTAAAARAGTEEIWSALEPALTRALARLLQMRGREGEAHRKDLQGHLETIGGLRKRMAQLAAGEPDRQRERLQRRAQQLSQELSGLDPARLAQEVALVAERSDITEELDRLRAHLDQTSGALEQQDPVGRKLEFLLQELHRELSTIGAKSLSTEISHLAVEGKAAVEKMRELSQNIE
jgi:uncharacterized protein (TIGR00255 family)